MQSISRRAFVISAATAGAAFGLDGPLEFVGRAFGQAATGPEVVKFKVGDVEVIQLYDGVWEKAHDEKFIANANVDQTKVALRAGGLTDAHVPITFTVTAVRTPGGLVLIDSGTGAQLAPTAGNITKNNLWKAAGIDPAEVTNILISHFHGDHISGLMAKDTNAPIFPKAQIHVPATEYKFWTNPSVTAGAAKRIQAVFPGWKNIRQYEGEIEVVPGVRAVSTPGHTPGHTSYHIGSGSQQLLVAGRCHQHPRPQPHQSRLASCVRRRPEPGGGQPAQVLRSRGRRQGYAHGIPLGHARCRHHRQGRQRLRFTPVKA